MERRSYSGTARPLTKVAFAQIHLGFADRSGKGRLPVPPDEMEAVRWFRKAEDQGDATAYVILHD